MFVDSTGDSAARQQRVDLTRLFWACTLSIGLHLLFFGSYTAGKRLGWWNELHLPAWLQKHTVLAQIKKIPAPPPKPENKMAEIPMVFVDITPAQATVEPPKTAPYYSDKNSVAANPEPKTTEAPVPEIKGEQTKMVRTEDVPKTKAYPLQPTPPPAPVAKETHEEEKPKPALEPGDLIKAKPEPVPQKEPGEAVKTRPKTIVEARLRQEASALSGKKMKQEGGVKKVAHLAQVDAIATGFGAYDSALIRAVQRRWDDLLESRNYASDMSGRVVVRFHLNSDGTVSEMSLAENTVDLVHALLCQSALKDPAPYAPWPDEMKQKIGASYREVTFVFYYN